MEQKIFDNHLVFERLARENGRCGGGVIILAQIFQKLLAFEEKEAGNKNSQILTYLKIGH